LSYLMQKMHLDIWKKCLGDGSVDFRPQNTKLLPAKLPICGNLG